MKTTVNPITAGFLNAIGNHGPQHTITATTAWKQEIIFTYDFMPELTPDPNITMIIDNDTGEIIHMK